MRMSLLEMILLIPQFISVLYMSMKLNFDQDSLISAQNPSCHQYIS